MARTIRAVWLCGLLTWPRPSWGLKDGGLFIVTPSVVLFKVESCDERAIGLRLLGLCGLLTCCSRLGD